MGTRIEPYSIGLRISEFTDGIISAFAGVSAGIME